MTKKEARKATNAVVPIIRAKTAQEAKQLLQDKGFTLRQFATSNGLDYRTVSEVVRGVNKGLHGKGHKVAVAFGIKNAA